METPELQFVGSNPDTGYKLDNFHFYLMHNGCLKRTNINGKWASEDSPLKKFEMITFQKPLKGILWLEKDCCCLGQKECVNTCLSVCVYERTYV